MIDLDDMERKARVATKGPWLDYGAVLRQRYPAKAESASSDTNEVRCGTASPSEVVVCWTGFDGQQNARHNAAYIAAASPDRVLKLIAEVRRLRRALRELTATVRGECPSLLNEDSGGDGALAVEIDALLGGDA